MIARNPVWRRSGWLLLALVLLVRAMLPQGMMPVAAPDGIRVAICTGSGPAFMVLGEDGKLHQETPEQKGAPCPYALATALADLPPALILPEPPALQAPVPPALLAARLVAARTLRPPARGPPETA
ncbi:DUF2946 family protein [Novosphingobium sp.]|uniref:DUF2946 family protein n=1 Tax=Novosphingobium sp. TaxID=1874826 RepID=UPI0025E9CF42|nr:DUF2946 family protein [Novosphingobium sp.]MCC6926868.1 hypothetical protein [Novosphingobium sp.]